MVLSMLQWLNATECGASAASQPMRHTLIIATFLLHQKTQDAHGGAFTGRTRSLKRVLANFVQNSPGLCGLGRYQSLLVLHDARSELGDSWAPAPATGIYVRRVQQPLRETLQPIEARWIHIHNELFGAGRGGFSSSHGEWHCAFAVDVSDVRVLRAAPCATLEEEGALVLASDHYNPYHLRRWLLQRSGMTRFNETWDTARWRRLTHRWLASAPLYNAGIVGGPRRVFEGALSQVVELLRRHQSRFPREAATQPGLDMLAWNDVAARIAEKLQEPQPTPIARAIVTGYPHGPANLPMSGQVRNHGRPCDETCRHRFLNQTRQSEVYWFAHKVPRTWTAAYQAWFPCAAAVRCASR